MIFGFDKGRLHVPAQVADHSITLIRFTKKKLYTVRGLRVALTFGASMPCWHGSSTTSYFQSKLSIWTAVFCRLVETSQGYGVEQSFFSDSHPMFSPDRLETYKILGFRNSKIFGKVFERFLEKSDDISNRINISRFLVSPDSNKWIENVGKPSNNSFTHLCRSLTQIIVQCIMSVAPSISLYSDTQGQRRFLDQQNGYTGGKRGQTTGKNTAN